MQPALGPLPSFSGHEGLSAAGGMQSGTQREEQEGPGGHGQSRCRLPNPEQMLKAVSIYLCLFSNVFAPAILEHFLWTGVQENVGKQGC